MKRLIEIKSITYLMLSLLAFPLFVFAAVDHSYPSATSPIYMQVTADNYDKDINCGGLHFWGVQVVEHITGETFSGLPRFVPASILSQEFTIDMPPGDYEEITFICSDDGENEAFQFGSIESDLAGDQMIFSASIVSAPETENILIEITPSGAAANVISAVDGIASTADSDSSVDINQEEQTDTVIVSDTNAESITSPLPQSDETATSTTPEGGVVAPPLSANTDAGEVITSEF